MNTNEFGLTEEEVQKVQENQQKATEVTPSVQLGELKVNNGIGDKLYFEFLEETPTLQEKKNGKKVPIMKVHVNKRVLNGKEETIDEKQTLWLNSKSLKTECQKMKMENGKLKGLKVKLTAREYEHEEHGTTRAYTLTKL